jgi:hypothetical protein
MRRAVCFSILAALGALVQALPAAAASDTLVSVGSPTTPFPQSWQNTPAVAVDPAHPSVVAATAQDAIDTAACSAWDDPTACPFARVGFSGVYFSFTGGASWIQPTYTGLTRRHCTGPAECQLSLDNLLDGLEIGPIGTVPNHYQLGMFATFEPSVAFGPTPGPDGVFSWDNGSRLYHAHEVQNLDPPFGPGFKGLDAIGVSRIDGAPLTPDIVADQHNWMNPVIVTHQSDRLVSQQASVWADNAESSPYFGNVYVCSKPFRAHPGANTTQIILDRSTDGGETWTERDLSQAETRATGGRDACRIRTDSEGTVYVFWNGAPFENVKTFLTRSFDGGATFERPRLISTHVRCGPGEDGADFDGLTGVEAKPSRSVDVANGAPTGGDATDQIVLVWCDGGLGLNAERAVVITSTDGGDSWSDPVDAAQAGDRPNMPAIAISPDGQDVYLVYEAFLDPARESLADPTRMQGVVRHAEASDLAAWITLHRGVVGDARASSGMSDFFDTENLGEYQGAVATRDRGIMLWTDIRNAERCPAIEVHRQSLVDGNPNPTPAPNTDCPPSFGNSDIYAAALPDPTP